MVTAQSAQRDGVSLLLSLTRDPARIEARLRQAALLEAADVPAPLVRALVKITTTGRLTHEDIHVMRDTGIDIDGMVTAIQRADHTLRTTQDHATAPRNVQNHNQVVPDGRDETRPAERRWRIRHRPKTRLTLGEWHGTITPRWHATDPECGNGRTPTTCTCTTHPTWQAAIDHVTQQLRDRALVAIENQEAPC